MKLLPPASGPIKHESIGKIFQVLTLVDKLHPFTGGGERLQLKGVQLCCIAQVVLLSLAAMVMTGGNVGFWHWNWPYFMQVLLWDRACKLCTLTSKSIFPSVNLPRGNHWLSSNKKAVLHSCLCCCAPGSFVERLCQNLKNFSCSLNGSAACSVLKKVAMLLFVLFLSPSLTA